MEEIKIWKISNDNPSPIESTELNFEARLENWILKDISIISKNLTIISSQVITDFGKRIDILGMDSMGDLVIVELKRSMTYREVIAQAFDYASWVSKLDSDEIYEILNSALPGKFSSLEDFYLKRFNQQPPESFNENHKILIVGTRVDDSTRRILNYLSPRMNVLINAITFNYFKDASGLEFLARSFILPEDEYEISSSISKKGRAEAIHRYLFAKNLLPLGTSLVYFPAVEQGISPDDPKINGTIVNFSQKYLKREADNDLFSFSSLRRKIIEECNLKNLNPNWGFSLKHEWRVKNGKTLAELAKD
jgi:hypothetical protein